MKKTQEKKMKRILQAKKLFKEYKMKYLEQHIKFLVF